MDATPVFPKHREAEGRDDTTTLRGAGPMSVTLIAVADFFERLHLTTYEQLAYLTLVLHGPPDLQRPLYQRNHAEHRDDPVAIKARERRLLTHVNP